jgi:hypothetical protein
MDIGVYVCPTCREEISGNRVSDPGLPHRIKAHRLMHSIEKLEKSIQGLRELIALQLAEARRLSNDDPYDPEGYDA